MVEYTMQRNFQKKEQQLVRVVIQQPALPAYRVPLFAEISKLSGYELLVVHGSEEPALTNATPDGFQSRLKLAKALTIFGIGKLYWHSAQICYAKKGSCDILILSANNRFLSLLPALLLARLSGVKTIVWGHFYSKNPGFWRDRFRRLPIALSDATIMYDSSTVEKLGLDKGSQSKVFIAPNGLDRRIISKCRDLWESGSGSSRLDDFSTANQLAGKTVLLFIGRLQRSNRLDVAIEALSHLTDDDADSVLIVIGDGEDERRRLQHLAERLDVSDRITWIGALYDETQVAPWMLCATFLVYPSNSGLSIIHAFNYSLPVAVCEPLSAHNPEIAAFKDNVNGVLAVDLSGKALADALRGGIQCKLKMSTMKQKALRTAQQEHNIDRMVEGFLEAFHSVRNRN